MKNPPPGRRDPALFWIGAIVLSVGTFASLASIIYFKNTLEDSFITYRYSEHFAQGYGMGSWNRTGQPVEGYTCALWMWMLALGAVFAIPVDLAAKTLGLLFYLGTLAPFALIAWRDPKAIHEAKLAETLFGSPARLRVAAICALILLGTSLKLAWYSVSGMEVTLFTCLSTWVLLGPLLYRSRLTWATLSALLVLTRPEGIVLTALTSAVYVGGDLALRIRPRANLLPIAVGGATFVGLTILRLVYFGHPLPNTYYAKAAGSLRFHLQHGADYVSEFVQVEPLTQLIFLIFIVLAYREWRQRKPRRSAIRLSLTTLSLFILAWYGYVLKSGGDNYWAFPFHRHFLHVAPVFALIAGLVISRFRGSNWIIAAAMALIVSFVSNQGVLTRGRRPLLPITESAIKAGIGLQQPLGKKFAWFLPFKNSTVTIASPFAGELAWAIDAEHIDVLGLNDEYIAHHGEFDMNGFVDSKSDMDHVMSRRPDLIMGIGSARAIIAGKIKRSQKRGKMTSTMFTNTIFRDEYSFVINGPYSGADRAVFARNTFCERHSRLKCLPVQETAIMNEKRKR